MTSTRAPAVDGVLAQLLDIALVGWCFVALGLLQAKVGAPRLPAV